MRLTIFLIALIALSSCKDEPVKPEPYKSEYEVRFSHAPGTVSSAYIVEIKDTIGVHIKDTVLKFQPIAPRLLDTTITLKANFSGYFVVRNGSGTRWIEYDSVKFPEANSSDSMYFQLPK